MNKEFEVLNHKTPAVFRGGYVQLNRFLENRQLSLLKESDERRSKIDSVEKLRAHGEFMRKEFIARIGGIPVRDCPLEARVTSVRDMGAFTIEGVIFKSRRDVYVTESL